VGRRRDRVVARRPLGTRHGRLRARVGLVGQVAALRGHGRLLRCGSAAAPDNRTGGGRSRRDRRGRDSGPEASHRASATSARRSDDPGARLAPRVAIVPVRSCRDRIRRCYGRRGASSALQGSAACPCSDGRRLSGVSRGSLLVGRPRRKPLGRRDRDRGGSALSTGPRRAATTRAESRTVRNSLRSSP
jgi:hypothetical protein